MTEIMATENDGPSTNITNMTNMSNMSNMTRTGGGSSLANARLAKYRHSQNEEDKAKRKNKIGASLDSLSLDDEDDYLLSHSSDEGMDLDDLANGGISGTSGTNGTNGRRSSGTGMRNRRQRPAVSVNKKKGRSKSNLSALDEDIQLESFNSNPNAPLLAQSDHIPKRKAARKVPGSSTHSEHARSLQPGVISSSEHSRTSAMSKKKPSPRKPPTRTASSGSVDSNGSTGSNVSISISGDENSSNNDDIYDRSQAHDQAHAHDYDRAAATAAATATGSSAAADHGGSPRQYTETLKDNTMETSASSDHQSAAARRRMSNSTHSRSASIDSDTGYTTTSTDGDSIMGQGRRNTRKPKPKVSRGSASEDGYGSDHGMKRRNKSTRSKMTKKSADLDGYGSDHGMKRRNKKTREAAAAAAATPDSNKASLDGYGSDHGMKRRVKSSRAQRKTPTNKPHDGSSRHESRTRAAANQEIDGYGSDHGMKRRVQRATRAQRKASTGSDDGINDDDDIDKKKLQRQNSSGRLSRFLDLIPGRSKRSLMDSKSVSGADGAGAKEKKTERKRSSSIGAMARRLTRRSERRLGKSQRNAAPPDAAPEAARGEGDALEHVRSPPRRHKSMDSAQVAGAEIHPPELFEGRDPTAPIRAQSMMMNRERTRRGKSDSLHNLQDYNPSELPSTSYFASNHILLNRERMKRGMKPLTRNKAMDELARDHANRMAESSGCTPLKATFVGNVVRGESIRVVHKAIMNNREGRERYNILNPYFQEFGIGTCKGDDGMLYVCQLFSESIELACVDT